MRDYLESHGFEVVEATSCKEAEAVFERAPTDAVILDHRLPDGNALELLARLRAIEATVPVVILTAYATIELAVAAIKQGAEHFLTKPVELSALLVVLNRLFEKQRNRRKVLASQTREDRAPLNPFLGSSPAIRSLAVESKQVAGSESPVLILGETGTGKGVLAQWIHEHSPRADEPFIDVNCAGLSREFLETELFGHQKGAFTGAVVAKAGLFEIAHNGPCSSTRLGTWTSLCSRSYSRRLKKNGFGGWVMSANGRWTYVWLRRLTVTSRRSQLRRSFAATSTSASTRFG